MIDELKNIPRDVLVREISNTFLGFKSDWLYKAFESFNEQLFNNELPPCLIHGVELLSGGAQGSFNANIGDIPIIQIALKSQSHHEQLLALIHEMQHYLNWYNNFEEDKHGLKWAMSLQHIHDKLNIKIDATTLTVEELQTYPFTIFQNYNINLEIDLFTYEIKKIDAHHSYAEPLKSSRVVELIRDAKRDAQVLGIAENAQYIIELMTELTKGLRND